MGRGCETNWHLSKGILRDLCWVWRSGCKHVRCVFFATETEGDDLGRGSKSYQVDQSPSSTSSQYLLRNTI